MTNRKINVDAIVREPNKVIEILRIVVCPEPSTSSAYGAARAQWLLLQVGTMSWKPEEGPKSEHGFSRYVVVYQDPSYEAQLPSV